MRLYLGGKMLGVADFNFMMFDEAAATLRLLGHDVFSPADRDRSVGFDPSCPVGSIEVMNRQGFSRREALTTDMEWIGKNSEGMVCLPNWVDSPGAKAEVAFHQALYLPVWNLDDFVVAEQYAPVVPLLEAVKDSHLPVFAERLAQWET